MISRKLIAWLSLNIVHFAVFTGNRGKKNEGFYGQNNNNNGKAAIFEPECTKLAYFCIDLNPATQISLGLKVLKTNFKQHGAKCQVCFAHSRFCLFSLVMSLFLYFRWLTFFFWKEQARVFACNGIKNVTSKKALFDKSPFCLRLDLLNNFRDFDFHWKIRVSIDWCSRFPWFCQVVRGCKFWSLNWICWRSTALTLDRDEL